MIVIPQEYSLPPRNVQTGGVDPGAPRVLIDAAARSAQSDVVDALIRAGRDVTQASLAEYVSEQSAAVSEALQEYRETLSRERDRYMRTNRGKDAIDAERHFDDFSFEAAQPLADRFSGRFRDAFMKDAAATGLHFAEEGRAYGRQQRAARDKSVFEGDRAQTLAAIAGDPGNREFIRFALDNLRERHAALFPDADHEAASTELGRAGAGAIIEGFLAKDNLEDARGAFEQYRDFLGESAAGYERKIREGEAKAEANRAGQARALLAGLKEAEYAAQRMGDASRLNAIADGLSQLGMEEKAGDVRARAEFWQVNRQAADHAISRPLPEVRDRIIKLRSLLAGEADAEKRGRLEGEVEAATRIFGDRARAYRDDPALAAQSAITLPDRATPEDIARIRMENQAINGVRPDALKPLTRDEAGQLAAQWAELPAEQSLSFLRKLEEYGPYAAMVMKQAGISVPEQDMAFALRDSPAAAPGAKALLSVLRLSENDLPDIDVRDALDRVLQDSDACRVYAAQAQAANVPDLWRAAKDYERAAARLLRTGRTPEQVQDILNAGRVGITGDNVAALVPAGRARAVESGLRHALGDRLADFVTTALSGAPDYIVEGEIRRIRNTGVFVNSPDGCGFTLLDGVTGLPYRNRQGEAFSLGLEEAAEAAPETDDLQWILNGLTGVSQ